MTAVQKIQATIVRVDLLLCRLAELWPLIAGVVVVAAALAIAAGLHRIRDQTGGRTAGTQHKGG